MDWRDHIAGAIRGETVKDAPLAARTSVRVGGAAALFVRPADVDDLVRLLQLVREANVPLWILGGGANTIVGDGGFPGVVVKLASDAANEKVETVGDSVRLDLSAGAPSGRLAQLAKEHLLLGAEWSAGIPGTIGGMTAMNAGTKSGEMKDNVAEVLLVDDQGAEWRPASDLAFAYRHADLHGKVVARVRLVLKKGSPHDFNNSLQLMELDRDYRKRTQPLNLPNSGSVFRNPPGSHAGRLVQEAGLKGAQEGGAQISEQHANFIVNRGGATAKDVTTLMARAQQEVARRFQIQLAPEVRLVGKFDPPLEVLGLVVAH